MTICAALVIAGEPDQGFGGLTMAHHALGLDPFAGDTGQRRRHHHLIGALDLGLPALVALGVFFRCVEGVGRPFDDKSDHQL